MDESAALDTTAARAVETADRDRVLWSDADPEWAGRVAAAIVGERASAEEFLGRRAQLVLERIGGGSSINLLAPAAPVCRCIAVPSGRSALLRLPTSRAG